MLNTKKIRWMTRASIYQKREGKVDLKRNDYFLSDYVRFGILRNLVGVTVAYILLASLYCLGKTEEIFVMITDMQIMPLIRQIVMVYLFFVAVYVVVSIFFYGWQYQSSHKRVKKYYRMLKLIEKYDQDEKKAAAKIAEIESEIDSEIESENNKEA